MKMISQLLATLCVALAVLVASPQADAQSYYYFSHFQTNNGLPNNTVYCTVQDNDGFIWVGTRDGICRYDGYAFYRMGDVPERFMLGGTAEALFVDSEGLLWFSTSYGKGYYDLVTGFVTQALVPSAAPITQILEDSDGAIWFVSSDLYKYNKETRQISEYKSNGYRFISAAVTTDGQFYCTCSDGRFLRYDSLVDSFKEEPQTGLQYLYALSDGRLLASNFDNEVILLNLQSGASRTIYSGDNGILCLLERIPGEFWISTSDGIHVFYNTLGFTYDITHSDSDIMSISSGYVTNLSVDREGNVWAGTYYDGLNLWRNTYNAYYLFYPVEAPGSITGKVVRCISPTSDGRIWIGTEDGGMNTLDQTHFGFRTVDLPGTYNNYQSIFQDGNEIWISTVGNGIIRYDLNTSEVTHHYHFADELFLCGLKTSKGDILVSSASGVFRYIPESDSFEKLPGLPAVPVMDMIQDSEGRIWLGTAGQGVCLLDSSLCEVERIAPGLRVTSFFEDSKQRMWVTTEGSGICEVDIQDLEISFINIFNGLISNITCSAVEDEEGMIWIGTSNGLCMLNPTNLRITISFFQKSQIATYQYSYGAAYRSPDNVIFMGTTGGMVAFSPAMLRALHPQRSVQIISMYGIHGNLFKELSAPDRSPEYTEKVVVSYKDVGSLNIVFASPAYSNILSTQYRYTFSYRGGEISEVTNLNYAMFTDVSYGRHTFKVSLVGSDEPEATKSVEIIVRPPFIKSIFAQILILLLFVSTLCGIFWLVVRQRQEMRKRQMAELERAKEREMIDSKSAFFMNVTHEVRTPLTLIKMPLDRMIKSGEYNRKDLLMIQANTDRLLSLTNQLLNVRKLEQDEEKMAFENLDLCELVRDTCERFIPAAKEQGVKLTMSLPDGAVMATCGRDSIDKIVSNLISNALKYGGDSISVELVSDEKRAVLRVDSNGDKIPAANREKIFEKFVHGGKGTGLGLPLARRLARLHDGRLYLDVDRTDLNSFVLELPLEHPDSLSVGPLSATESAEEPAQTYDEARRDILIVEDNQEFRLYLAEVLSAEFNVFTAPNGRAALEKLAARKIDLIVSDIMMPVMDGCELCNYVKSNVEYSHIPVILLTAAVGMDTRIETLEIGADGYIEKPFPIELLQVNIANVFKNREIANRQFTNSPLAHLAAVTTTMDEKLLSSLNDIVLANLSEDKSLGIEDLAAQLNMSSSTLYRKVKANTGMNVNEYIKLCRLKHAAELLASGNYRINEVADMTGFSSSSYFAANFQKQFNVSPSSFLKSLGLKS